jgi:hypothetical protein
VYTLVVVIVPPGEAIEISLMAFGCGGMFTVLSALLESAKGPTLLVRSAKLGEAGWRIVVFAMLGEEGMVGL